MWGEMARFVWFLADIVRREAGITVKRWMRSKLEVRKEEVWDRVWVDSELWSLFMPDFAGRRKFLFWHFVSWVFWSGRVFFRFRVSHFFCLLVTRKIGSSPTQTQRSNIILNGPFNHPHGPVCFLIYLFYFKIIIIFVSCINGYVWFPVDYSWPDGWDIWYFPLCHRFDPWCWFCFWIHLFYFIIVILFYFLFLTSWFSLTILYPLFNSNYF